MTPLLSCLEVGRGIWRRADQGAPLGFRGAHALLLILRMGVVTVPVPMAAPKEQVVKRVALAVHYLLLLWIQSILHDLEPPLQLGPRIGSP